MRIFVDSSVLIAAVLREHENHGSAFALLERIQLGKDEAYVASHSLAEFYATLTRLPAPFRHSPEEALLSLEENVVQYFQVVDLGSREYIETLRSAAARGIHGGTTYDALLLKAAVKAKAGRIYTFNLKHFRAIAERPLADLLASP